MAKSLTMNGRKKLATLQREFTEKFPYLTLVFLDAARRSIPGDRTLAQVRTRKGEDLSIVGSLKVATFEARCADAFGLTVEVAYQTGGELQHTSASVTHTLSGLNAWCEEQGMERIPLVSIAGARATTAVREAPAGRGARARTADHETAEATPRAPSTVNDMLARLSALATQGGTSTGDHGDDRGDGRADGDDAGDVAERRAAMLAEGVRVLTHPSYQSSWNTFRTIVTDTGILDRDIIREPDPSERDALWEVVRAFAARLYASDIEPNASVDERNVLAHFAVVALHWCDIYITDPRHTMDNGRFRRDTLALALCLYARIAPSYRWHDHLKRWWIAPHTNFSYLLWSLQSILLCRTDNLFHTFTAEDATAANDRQLEINDGSGYLPVADEPPGTPLHRIWLALREAVLGTKGPHQFALNYIWNSASLPGGMGLLAEDREMNKAYLQGVVSGEAVGPRAAAPPEASRYLSAPDEYPGPWYLPNAHWNADGMMLRIKSFPNIFAGGRVRQDQLFRRFTEEEVDRIERKIRAKGTLIYLPFVRDALAERFDVRGMKPPFWFIPFVAFGNDRGGVLYFEENGFFTNVKSPESLDSTGHVDRFDRLSVTAGYNGLNDSDEDDAILSSLCMEGHTAAGDPRVLNIVEFHGEGYGATLRIALAIWEAAWQGVVERSRGGSAFMLGPPPWPEAFGSWDELLEWARDI